MNLKSLKQKLVGDLYKRGKVIFINKTNNNTREIINYNFSFNGVLRNIDEAYKEYYRRNILPINLNPVVDLLKHDSTTRRAFITFWYNSQIYDDMPPCFCGVQILIRDKKLCLIISQRSMHLRFLEQDVSFFSLLSEEFCNKLKINTKNVIMTFNVGSIHEDI